MKLQKVRGTRDIIGDEAQLFREIDHHFATIAKVYDFQEIETPIFEFTQVFQRTLGDESDIVNKEMYTFEDRSGDSLTLRPEGTASVARAVISNSLLRDLPLKLFYSGPMFRHERPQKGRYRQFRQFGVELLGVPAPIADVEVLACAWDFFKVMNLTSSIQLEINTIGDTASRNQYRQNLIQYFSQYEKDLSEESQKRLQTNPLRILDSKDEKDQKLVAGAPLFSHALNSASKDFFEEVCKGLQLAEIPFSINERLVRGLDYYCHSVFEFTTQALGTQNAVLSGGRYDQLIATMGGPDTPGVGWAAGTDRLALLLRSPQSKHQTVAILMATPSAETSCHQLLHHLRQERIPSQLIYSGNLSKQLKKAHKRSCSHAVIIGEDELKTGKYQIKNLESGDQSVLATEQLLTELKSYYEL